MCLVVVPSLPQVEASAKFSVLVRSGVTQKRYLFSFYLSIVKMYFSNLPVLLHLSIVKLSVGEPSLNTRIRAVLSESLILLICISTLHVIVSTVLSISASQL